jgi:AhpD family alkylhydroperoxidase
MSDLAPRDRELVALGAAMGSNCVPCVEYHIRESRRVGLTDPEIRAAIEHADKIRQVPARKALQAASNLLSPAGDEARNTSTKEGCGCAQPRDLMIGMMTKMMGTAEKKPAADPATSEGCECG